ncbi:MAG: hypothetical protein ABEJ30_01510 [Halorientalis sp.]
MTDVDLADVVEAPEAAFRRDLGDALAPLSEPDALASYLVRNPDAYERLLERMATLDDPAEFAAEAPETVDRFLAVLWSGIEIATTTLPPVEQAVTMDTSVNWTATDSPVAFHATADATAGTVAGGPGLLEDPEVTFEGRTDVLFAMLGDESFNAPLAYIQNRYEVIGPLERARAFDEMMDEVRASMESMV